MVLNYTAGRRRRREDLYQRDGAAFFSGHPPDIKFKIRPDRTLTVFTSRLREAFPGTPVVVGGVEASLRCFAHYDFQEDKVRRSLLLDSRADILVSGNGEKQVVAIARQLQQGVPAREIDMPGTARIWTRLPPEKNCLELPPCEEVQADPAKLLRSQLQIGQAGGKRALAQKHAGRWVVLNPAERYESSDLDHIYGLGYRRLHPNASWYSPALRMNLFSITSHRGCAGGCAFCSITLSEGRRVVSRSPESVLGEIASLAGHPEWRGVVSDVGGATAEMYGSDCQQEACGRDSCLQPGICGRFGAGEPYRDLLRRCRSLPGVKKVMLGSGVRHDLLLRNPDLLEEIMREHCGRFLRVAPEHTEDEVLDLMGKPRFAVFEEFARLFQQVNRKLRRPVALAPYLIVGHPGETAAMVELMKEKLRGPGPATPATRRSLLPLPEPFPRPCTTPACRRREDPLAVEKDIRALQERKRLLTG